MEALFDGCGNLELKTLSPTECFLLESRVGKGGVEKEFLKGKIPK